MRRIIMITTERMKIYPVSPEKMREVIDSEKDPELRKAYSEMMEGCLREPENYVWYALWFMELRTPGREIAGDLCFKGIDSNGRVEIGYGIKEGFGNKGYMTEAVSAAAEWASRQPGVTGVEAEAEESNPASVRVLEKSGFVPNGERGKEGIRFVWNGKSGMNKER